MPPQSGTTFGAALRQALDDVRRNQAWLAVKLGRNPGQVSRWVQGKAFPKADTVEEMIKEISAINEDVGQKLEEAYRSPTPRPQPDPEPTTPEYELFVSSPISAPDNAAIEAHPSDVEKVVEAAEQVVDKDKVYWSGRKIAGLHNRRAPDIATQETLTALLKSQAYLYVQFAKTVRPSGALVELGFALCGG